MIKLILGHGSPAILGVPRGDRRIAGEGEDPWLCVSGFRRICLFRGMDCALQPEFVNSGLYVKLLILSPERPICRRYK